MVKKGMWCKMPLELLEKDVALSVKVVYIYMLARSRFFEGQGLDYFESQEAIARATGLTRKTVNLSIQEMQKMQWVELTKSDSRGNSYTIKDVYAIYS